MKLRIIFSISCSLWLLACNNQPPEAVSVDPPHQKENREVPRPEVDTSKPEVVVDIDREKARAFGLSTAQIGQHIQQEVFDANAGKITVEELASTRIEYRDVRGKKQRIPLSAVARISIRQANPNRGVD